MTYNPHHRSTWIIRSYLPGGANVTSHLIHGFLGPFNSASEWSGQPFLQGCQSWSTNTRDVTEPAKICFHRIRILCFRSVGFRHVFATHSQLFPLSCHKLHGNEIPHNTSFCVSLAHYYLLYIHRHIFRKGKHWNPWIGIYQCLYILNTKLDDISRSLQCLILYRYHEIAIQCAFVYFCMENGRR